MKSIKTRLDEAFSKALCIVVGAALLTAFGCDSAGKKVEQKEPMFDLSFSAGSSGLPSTEQWRQGLAFHDMNGDGHMDILSTAPRTASEKARHLWIWFGNGKGEWSAAPLSNVPGNFVTNYGSIAASDFNGDHIPDIAVAMHGVGLRALKGSKSGKYEDFSAGMPEHKAFAARALVAGDFNNDGIEDVAAVSEYVQDRHVVDYGGVLTCFWQDGRWRCKKAGNPEESIGLLSDQIITGDVNDDGNIDLGVASRNSQRDLIVWLGDGKGNFMPFNKGLPRKMHYNSVFFADVNKDGRDDLIASISGQSKDFKGLKVFLSGPDGFTDKSNGLPSGDQWSYFASAGDLSGDGNIEIVAATKEGGLKVYRQQGDGWKEMRISGLPDKGLYRIYGLYCLDLNEDGRKDIAVVHSDANEKTGGINVFLTESDIK